MFSHLAAVDLGSNSFRLEIARVDGDLLYPVDDLKAAVRLAAGLGADKRLDAAAFARGLSALAGFAERLQGFPPEAVRAVGTACATNPLPLVLPCHRVVRSDGGIGRYRGGEQAKRDLLALEA